MIQEIVVKINKIVDDKMWIHFLQRKTDLLDLHIYSVITFYLFYLFKLCTQKETILCVQIER